MHSIVRGACALALALSCSVSTFAQTTGGGSPGTATPQQPVNADQREEGGFDLGWLGLLGLIGLAGLKGRDRDTRTGPR